MQRRIKAILTFYKHFWTGTSVVTLFCCYSLIKYKEPGYIILFTWLKLITDSLFLYFWYSFKADLLYYYYNLGLTKRVAFASVFGIDLLLFSILMFITCNIL